MTKNMSTKKALLTSALCLLLCCSMLVGTTFAWFTDEVTSTNNIIKSGTLDVEMYYGDSADAITNDASKGAIFNYQYWEPGYTEVKYITIKNVGDLAFKFKLNIIPDELNFEEYNLADVIDVYMIPVTEGMEEVTRENYATMGKKVGTLSSLMADADGAAYGYLLPAEGVGADSNNVNPNEDPNAPRGEISYCIVLKMQETAGNEYQNLTVGNGFSVQLLATQYTWENDSINHTYDDGAEYDEAPKANVVNTGAQMIQTSTHGDILANTTFQFQPTETLEEAQKSPYRYYHADFVVYADKDIPAESVILPGYYSAYCDGYNNYKWLGLSSDEVIAAGTQIRLIDVLGEALNGSLTVNYEDICRWGNDGTGFLCGISAVTKDGTNEAVAAGTTITVELRLYEVPAQGECAHGGGCTHPYKDCETGEDNYITIGTYTYTIPAVIEAPANP